MVNPSKHGPWAVVTGASAGLGEHFARQLAASGLNLFLVARRQERLEVLCDQLKRAHGVQARYAVLDLAQEGSDLALDQATADLDVGLLVDNAGAGYFGRFDGQDPERLAAMIRLNCTGVMLVAHRFVGRFKRRGRGGIIIVASLAGFQATPWMSVYGATKGFDLLFGEGLAQELRGSGIDVLVLNPGSTSTEFGKVAGSTGGGFSMRPEKVVGGAIRALGRKVVYVPGATNKLVALVDRIFPRGFVAHMSGRTLRKITPPEHW